MNVLTISGNLGRDARLNSVQTGSGPMSVLNFAVGVRKRQKDQQGNAQTLWVECALWGKRADSLAQYMLKGTKVTVTGEADVDTYQDGQGVTHAKMTLTVNDVDMHGSNSATAAGAQASRPQGNSSPANANRAPQQPAANQPPMDFDDDIPF